METTRAAANFTHAEAGNATVDVDAAEVRLNPKRLVLHLEKCINNNMLQRAKFPEDPEQFVDSEVELDEAVQQLAPLAAVPKTFSELVRLKAVDSLVGLLAHPNTDISSDVLTVLNDMFAQDDEAPQESETQQLAKAFVDLEGPLALVKTITRFNAGDDDGANAIYNAMTTLENLFELLPSLVERLCRESNLLGVLVEQLRPRAPSAAAAATSDGGAGDAAESTTRNLSTRQYAAELLAIVTQERPAVQARLFQLERSVSSLLEVLAEMRRRRPASAEEKELINDVFDVLNSCSFVEANKTRLYEVEALELMLLLIRRARWLRPQCVKALDYMIMNRRDGCERLVDVGGLGVLCPLFVGVSGHAALRSSGDSRQILESSLSVLCELFRRLRGSHRERLYWKFKDSSYERMWRLVYVFHDALLRAKQYSQLDYVIRLERGLYMTQLAAMCIASLAAAHGIAVVKALLEELQLTASDVTDVLIEYVENLAFSDDGDDDEDGEDVDSTEKAERKRQRDEERDDALQRTRLEKDRVLSLITTFEQDSGTNGDVASHTTAAEVRLKEPPGTDVHSSPSSPDE